MTDVFCCLAQGSSLSCSVLYLCCCAQVRRVTVVSCCLAQWSSLSCSVLWLCCCAVIRFDVWLVCHATLFSVQVCHILRCVAVQCPRSSFVSVVCYFSGVELDDMTIASCYFVQWSSSSCGWYVILHCWRVIRIVMRLLCHTVLLYNDQVRHVCEWCLMLSCCAVTRSVIWLVCHTLCSASDEIVI